MTPDGHEINIDDPDHPFGADGQALSKKKRANIEKRLGQGKKVVSWIWTTAQSIVSSSDDVLHEGKSFSITCDQTEIHVQLLWSNGQKRVQGIYDGGRRCIR